MRVALIAANWKENLDKRGVEKWLEEFGRQELVDKKQEVVICPSFPLIPVIARSQTFRLFNFHLGAQNVSWFEEGAYTGEVSVGQLRSLGVEYVIVGHSERREYFGETNDQVGQKVKLCLRYGLTPIVCVSDLAQVEAVASFDFSLVASPSLIIAYEPLSAISTGATGRPDTPEHARKMALATKKILGDNVLVLYGGSVDSQNAEAFLRENDINGILVGRASLEPVEFAKIVRAASVRNTSA